MADGQGRAVMALGVRHGGFFGGAFAFASPHDGWLLFQAPANNGILFALRHRTTAGNSWRTVPVPNLTRFANYMNGNAGLGLTLAGGRWRARGFDGSVRGLRRLSGRIANDRQWTALGGIPSDFGS